MAALSITFIDVSLACSQNYEPGKPDKLQPDRLRALRALRGQRQYIPQPPECGFIPCHPYPEPDMTDIQMMRGRRQYINMPEPDMTDIQMINPFKPEEYPSELKLAKLSNKVRNKIFFAK